MIPFKSLSKNPGAIHSSITLWPSPIAIDNDTLNDCTARFYSIVYVKLCNFRFMAEVVIS